ncbi:MAG TPA: cytochrome c-type biogenesis protein CcmH [Gaiellaceae bacterium]|nr:cytochrome c-type biogenesis protein CcmH [Gaiellaceae bacterium]
MRLAVAVLAALVLAAPAAACKQQGSQAYLETRLVCITCHTTLDESDSTFAVEMKQEIARQIKACRTNSQIIDSMVSQFGPAVLSTPQTHGFDLIAWVLPLGGILLGAAALAFGARRWQAVRTPASVDSTQSPLDAEDERRVDEELKNFDA